MGSWAIQSFVIMPRHGQGETESFRFQRVRIAGMENQVIPENPLERKEFLQEGILKEDSIAISWSSATKILTSLGPVVCLTNEGPPGGEKHHGIFRCVWRLIF